MSTPTVTAIIVTRNNRRDIGPCLASVQASQAPINEVVVIDHDSTDGTPDLVRREFRETIVLDFLDNPGFGEGNNRGARVASGDYLLLLNPDAIVASDTVQHLIGALETCPGAAIAVPKVVLAAEPSIINSAGLLVNEIGYGWDRGYLEWDAQQYSRPEAVLAGSGCALLVRADVFRAIGGFDARYFLYYEDIDLCWRSWIAGHSVQYVPQAVVRHAMKVSGRSSFFNDYLDHRNRLLTLLQNASATRLAQLAPQVARFEISNTADLTRRRLWRALRHRTQAWNWNLGQLPATLRRRRAVQRSRKTSDGELLKLFVPGKTAPRLKAALPAYREMYEHLVDREHLQPELIMGTNDVGMLGLGWHGLESFDGVPSRWCCGYGIAFLRAPIGCRDGRVRVRCAAVRPTEIAIRVGREERGRFQLDIGSWRDLVVQAPFSGELVRVEILAHTFVPSEIDPTSPDIRTLGVPVAQLTVER
jgi:GT2 family glycosyltransferase